ncbi:SLC13 family permease [Virgibacillus siamensis]|uniref:SLC13 family permease n=1 Tax=Virgibacillus siamensis TaxID=480071 RepID=UPI000985231C|nr:SLC13 family permease [Virgibacillus siamensis]
MKWRISFFIMMVSLFFLTRDSLLAEFSTVQKLTLGLLVAAVYLWVASPLPSGATSILLIALMMLLGLADGVEEAVVGFLSPALYFIIMLSFISHSLVKVGIDRVIVRLLVKISRSGPGPIVCGLPVFIAVLPIILPSAVARFKILLPLLIRLNTYFGFGEKSLFKKFSLYVIGMMNQNATMIIFTGGGFPVLASQLLSDYGVADIGWLEWFGRIAPPLWFGLLIVTIFVWHFLKATAKDDEWGDERQELPLEEKEQVSMPLVFWIAVIGFLLMIVAWIITDREQVPLVLPPMLLVVLYALPKMGLINNNVIRSYDWENFLLLGASFSLGMLMSRNGTAKELAEQLLELVPQDGNMVLKVLFIALFIFVLRFLFVVPSSAVIVIFPIVISYAELIGIAPVNLSFLVVMIIGGMMVLPIHSPTTFYAFETGVFTKKEQYVIGVFSSFIILIMAVIAALYYW